MINDSLIFRECLKPYFEGLAVSRSTCSVAHKIWLDSLFSSIIRMKQIFFLCSQGRWCPHSRPSLRSQRIRQNGQSNQRRSSWGSERGTESFHEVCWQCTRLTSYLSYFQPAKGSGDEYIGCCCSRQRRLSRWGYSKFPREAVANARHQGSPRQAQHNPPTQEVGVFLSFL